MSSYTYTYLDIVHFNTCMRVHYQVYRHTFTFLPLRAFMLNYFMYRHAWLHAQTYNPLYLCMTYLLVHPSSWCHLQACIVKCTGIQPFLFNNTSFLWFAYFLEYYCHSTLHTIIHTSCMGVPHILVYKSSIGRTCLLHSYLKNNHKKLSSLWFIELK